MYVCIYTRETRNVMCSVYLPNTILHKYKMYAGCRTLCRIFETTTNPVGWTMDKIHYA